MHKHTPSMISRRFMNIVNPLGEIQSVTIDLDQPAKYRLLPEQRIDIRAKMIAAISELTPFEIQCYNTSLKRQWSMVNNVVI